MARTAVQQESTLILNVQWSGPHSISEVLKEFNRGGAAPEYDGPDYGLYQNYGKHILGGNDTLLYIGKSIQQTFAARFAAHRTWLEREDGISVYLGRAYDEQRHLSGPNNEWPVWVSDLHIAECVLIYTYSPNYNSVSITEPPSLSPYAEVILRHSGAKYKLRTQDTAPKDW
jgi:hypothetical protein